MKYIVELKYTNPAHEHVSLRRRVETRNAMVEASNDQEAILRASRQQASFGYKVHSAKVVNEQKQLSEKVEQTDESRIAGVLGAMLDVEKRREEKIKGDEESKGYSGSPAEIKAKYYHDLAKEKIKGKVKPFVSKSGIKEYLPIKGKIMPPKKIGEELEQVEEGFDTDPKDIAAYLVNRHGKGKVTMDHIEAYERRRDSHRGIEKHEVMKHVKKMSEEVEQIDELKKSTLASYVNKAARQARVKSEIAANLETHGVENPASRAYFAGAKQRLTGIEKATAKLAKEEIEQVDEEGYYVMGKTQSVSWHKNKQEAEKEAARLNMRGGTNHTVKSAARTDGLKKEEVEQTDESRIAGVLGAMADVQRRREEKQQARREQELRDKAARKSIRKAMEKELEHNPKYKTEEVESVDEAQKKLKPSYWRAEWRLGTQTEVDKNNKKIYDRLAKTDPVKAKAFHDNLVKLRKEESMPDYVKAGQKKFDAQTKQQRATEKAGAAQAGTLAAKKMRTEAKVNVADKKKDKLNLALNKMKIRKAINLQPTIDTEKK